MKIPKEVVEILEKLEERGFEAYIVGGCVRDILLKKKPKDWDITTNAKPEQVQEAFKDSFYENRFGTVGIKTGSEKKELKVVEVTTFRAERGYTDKRRPDEVEFVTNLEEDLKRRDFTINALALRKKEQKEELIDLFGGKNDLEEGLIRTVGDPKERFNEDALRLMRAIRFATVFDFKIEKNTLEAIKDNKHLIKNVSNERVRDELIKTIDNPHAHKGILRMKETGLLHLVLPEIAKGIDVGQNKHHIHDVFEHNLYSLQWAAENDYNLHVKFAALLHDVGKPQTKKGDGPDSTFYGHEVVGAKISDKLLRRLRFPNDFREKVVTLVRNHLFYYEVDEVTESSVRRLIARVRAENMNDLVKLRICDRMGSGVPKPEPYRLRHFQYLVEKVQKDPVSVEMLKMGGNELIEELNIKQGPKIGKILNILLDEVLDDPKKNKKKTLLKIAEELSGYPVEKLDKMAEKAKNKQEQVNTERDEEIKKKYHVK